MPTHTQANVDLWHFLLYFALLCFCFFFFYVSHKYFARSFCLVPIDRSTCQRDLRRLKTWMQKVWNFATCLCKAATDGASATVFWFQCKHKSLHSGTDLNSRGQYNRNFLFKTQVLSWYSQCVTLCEMINVLIDFILNIEFYLVNLR